MLSTECADKLELFELITISVDESCPLIHLISCFFVEFILEVVILLFELLRQFPNDIVFEFEELSLLLVVIHEDPALSKLSWQVIRQHINLNLKMFGASILNVIVQLPVFMQEL